MKLFPAILLSGLLALTLAGCTAQSTSGGVSAAASALDATANASPIQIKLNRVKVRSRRRTAMCWSPTPMTVPR